MTRPSFTSFFEALHPGRSPFPWQVRLAEQVLTTGWPDLLDLPTGVGKTSALDVALYSLSIDPASLPRRTLLVVDRRIVVDQGAQHALTVQQKLTEAQGGPLRYIADALRDIWKAPTTEAPFAVAVMRGGMPRDNDWARRPDMPVLGVSTVDQVGSRMLFRGYGVGSRSASIHAGLLGNDTLVLLDEVHLARPFAQTLEAIRCRYRRSVEGLPDRFSVVRMSATPGRDITSKKVFSLAPEDRENPTLRQRLKAVKKGTLVVVKVSGPDETKKREVVAQRAVQEALRLQSTGAKVVGLVVNRVDTARLAIGLLRKKGADTDAILVTGRMRGLDRDLIVRKELVPRAGAGRERGPEEKRLVVVATQCVEAGADLDFDGLVTECASIEALRQRFGRVDRRGELGETDSIILCRSDQAVSSYDDPIYGSALTKTWEWLNEVGTGGAIDMGVAGLPAPVGPDGQLLSGLLAPVLDAPVMLPSHLDAWAQTSALPTPDPDVALWLHGPRRPAGDVQVVWREDIGLNGDPRPLIERLSACRPSSLESITIPLAAARQWLAALKEAPPSIADVVAGSAEGTSESEEFWRRAKRDRKTRQGPPVALRWTGDDSTPIWPAELRPGDVLVVDCSLGGLADHSFDSTSKERASDLGDLAQLRGRGIATLRLHSGALKGLGLPAELIGGAPTPYGPPEEASTYDPDEAVREWIEKFPASAPAGFPGTELEWTNALGAWRSSRARSSLAGGQLILTAPLSRAQRRLQPEFSEALTEDDDSSFREVEVTLQRHSGDVRDFAKRFGEGVGFGPEIVQDLALAGWLHDIGKADPRFQRWLVGGGEVRAALMTEPLAKSALPAGNAQKRQQARMMAGYPRGTRHELLSLDMISSSEAILSQSKDRELVMHLVASHHGWCRPFAPPVDDPEDLAVSVELDSISFRGRTRHRLARLDSGVSDRFWGLVERYGWWGLAWLEAVLRLADHRASAHEAEASR